MIIPPFVEFSRNFAAAAAAAVIDLEHNNQLGAFPHRIDLRDNGNRLIGVHTTA
jgi:hypothetical protein